MIRRRTAGLLVALTGGFTLTGCATFEDSDAAAVVAGTPLSRDDYEQFLQLYVDNSDRTGVTEDPATGTIDGVMGRERLTELVLTLATKEFLTANGESITDQERADALGALEAGNPVLEAPQRVQNNLIDGQLVQAATARVDAPDAATIEAAYTDAPGRSGALCARHILVATEAEAVAVRDELEAGADFAELAAERSTYPTAADTGGVLAGQDGSECLPLTAITTAGAPFVEAVLDAEIGVPSVPVQTSVGWHVLLARPYDEIAEPLAALYAAQAGQVQLGAYLAKADIRVDPRYGRWDRFTNTVIAL